ncbi:hypothetical protein H1164_08285 [Thermoactinomyces daqus]|uniref:Minor capsid protein n=1 Tax=Thermoactinomyces daqus TaxID=1329516 RepID=A0A7W1XA16_9BACL|nr:phage minor capsid protein [Thermoactinomyces daqus]MBA4542898.1 hypothetical protein [Thermoactinomyces daqus]
MTFNIPPRESYEEIVAQLIAIYEKAASKLVSYLGTIDFYSLTNYDKVERNVNKILADADTQASKWVKKAVEFAYETGAANAIYTLGDARSMTIARKMVDLENQLAQATMKSIGQVTYNDLLLMTNNTRQRIKDTITKVVVENLKGRELNRSSKEISRKIINDLREQAMKDAHFSIIDRAGKNWTIESYSKMIARTKIMQAQIDGTVNESLTREAFYGVISSHGSKHASCARWEGRIVKLDERAPGDYPLLSTLRMRGSGIFHPNCKHHVLPFRTLEVLPPQIKAKNNIS